MLLAVILISLSDIFKAALANPPELSKRFRFIVPLAYADCNFLALCTPGLRPWVVWRGRIYGYEEPKARTVLKMPANERRLPLTVGRAFHEAVGSERLAHDDG